jgi:hypothetical protein
MPSSDSDTSPKSLCCQPLCMRVGNSQLVAVVSDDRTKRREIAKRYRLDRTFTYDQFAPELVYFSDFGADRSKNRSPTVSEANQADITPTHCASGCQNAGVNQGAEREPGLTSAVTPRDG